MKRKIRMLFLVTLSLLFLAGFGKKTVELLSDKKLIDLNAAISLCLPGADSSEKEDGDTQTDLTPAPTAAPTTVPAGPAEYPENTRVITISIRGDIITYAAAMWIQPEKLEEKIRLDYRENVSFRLEDDFAEAHVYRKALAILKELETEIGLTFTAD